MARENKFGKSHFEAFGCFKLEEHDQDYLGVAKQRLGESPEIKIQTLVSFKEKLKNEHQTLHHNQARTAMSLATNIFRLALLPYNTTNTTVTTASSTAFGPALQALQLILQTSPQPTLQPKLQPNLAADF